MINLKPGDLSFIEIIRDQTHACILIDEFKEGDVDSVRVFSNKPPTGHLFWICTRQEFVDGVAKDHDS